MHTSEGIPDREPAATIDVAIIGAGASGVLLAIHLMSSPSSPKTIALIGNTSAVGEGIAYSTVHAEHLLNVTANRMSAFDDAPGDFVQFLARTDAAFSALSSADQQNHFAERRAFAQYLRESLNGQPSNALQLIHDEATDIEFDRQKATITLVSGRTIRSRAVVLAIGNFPRRLPLPNDAIDRGVRLVDSWNYDAIAAIDRSEDVAIVGSGLSMVDTVLTLARSHHRGRIHVISRHGLFPLPHASTSRRGSGANPLAGQQLRTMMQSLRRAARDEIARGNPWQFVMDDVRPHIQQIWQGLDNREQHRFMRHLARYWEIHRHRIAPPVYAMLERMQRSGQIARWAGRVREIRQIDGVSEVRLDPSRGREKFRLRANRIVNSLGLELNLRHVENRLLHNLFARGLVKAGKHGLGLQTDEHGALCSSDGAVSSNFYTLGATRIGQLLESIAVPELRTQAQRLAHRILCVDSVNCT